MNKLLLLFGVLVCLMAVNARHFVDRSAEDSSDTQETRPRDHIARHRKRRWQSNYGYDYSPPSYYNPDRRDDRNNQEVIQHIYRLLEDISAYIRRTPQPQPQPIPIYVPYPVAFPTRVTCKTPKNTTNSNLPFPDKRITSMEDANQNWGVIPQEDYSDDEDDGARPISFEPLVPKQFLLKPAPQVDHGSQQAAFATEAPKLMSTRRSVPAALGLSQSAPSSSSAPGMCNAAILSCCGFSGDKAQQRQCFFDLSCGSNYGEGSACTPESIQRSLDSFKQAYSPVQ